MNNLLYLSYGEGLHEQEVIFSLLSAWRHVAPNSSGWRFLVYTDRPKTFAGLPLAVEPLATEQLAAWAGASRTNDRRKIAALGHALRKYAAPTVLLDGDTWLRKSPELLFSRIGPGRAIMHLLEGRLMDIGTPIPTEMASVLRRERFVDTAGEYLNIPPNSPMWNSGVLGMDPADAGVLDEALHLLDQLSLRSTVPIRQWEQFAVSFVLAQRMRELQEAGDVVFHYWPPYLHEPFRKKLPEVMAKCAVLPLAERARRCFAERPRPTGPRRAKVIVKRAMQGLGLLRRGARSSEW